MALSVAVELQLTSGVWTDVTADVLPPVTGTYGIDGSGPNDRVATTGTFRFALRNDAGNSGGAIGYYSPGHPSCRGGFDLGIKARVRVSDGVTTVTRGIGTITAIAPTTGQYRGPRTFVEFVDYFDAAATLVVSGVSTQTSQRADQLITTLLAAVTPQPESTALDTGDSTFDYGLDTALTGRPTLLQLMAEATYSEGGYLYMTGAGALTFKKRTARAADVSEDADFDDEMEGLTVERTRDGLVNKVLAIVHPRRVDADATTVLYSLDTTPGVAAGQTINPFGAYGDPNNANRRCGGTDMVPPVATTDYTMNAQADGGGADMTADFTVTASFGAAGVRWTITNGHATDTGYITKLQCRGKGIYDFQSIAMEAESSGSISTYGEQAVTLDMPYEQDLVVGDSFANYILNLYSAPVVRANRCTFTSVDGERLSAITGVDVGDRVVLTETVTGVASAFFVNGLSYTVDAGPIMRVTWTLAPASADTFWLLEDVGYSELGDTTRLGFS